MQETGELSKSGDALLSVVGADRKQLEGRGSSGRGQRKSASAGKRRRVETLNEEEPYFPSL